MKDEVKKSKKKKFKKSERTTKLVNNCRLVCLNKDYSEKEKCSKIIDIFMNEYRVIEGISKFNIKAYKEELKKIEAAKDEVFLFKSLPSDLFTFFIVPTVSI